ncbi:Bug family tripartite tricarboxylate transporter substrate binding protein [Verticiella sediminum]|nr:tripartite tricarboxylate transporter substrate binding protein [Verticiella sediminum]
MTTYQSASRSPADGPAFFTHLAATLGWLRAGALALCAAGALAAAPALAADWPQRPVNLIVPYPAGGATDLLGRVVAQRLSEQWKQPVTVDNRGGAGGMIGAEATSRAAPDGYTLMLTLSSMLQLPHMQPSATLDARKDLTAITMAAVTPLVLVVNESVPARTPAELADLARKDPKRYGSYGSYGTGSTGHLLMHVWGSQQNLELVHVAYKGEAPSVTDVLGGQIPAVIMSQNGALPHLKSGKLRALALTGAERARDMPDVPTFKELGYTGMELAGWFGVFAPPGLPQPLSERIAADVRRVLEDPATAEQVAPAGIIIKTSSSPEVFKQQVAQDYERWADVVRDAGLKAD